MPRDNMFGWVKPALGLLLVAVGFAIAAYVGVWLMLVGGIVQGIEAAKATPVESAGIAIGVVKVLFAGAVGWLSALIPAGIGQRLIRGA